MRQWAQSGRTLSKKEKALVTGSFAVILVSMVFLLGQYFFAHRLELPAFGGEYTEALVGGPQFINPLYAPANDADADLARLMYSGLLRWDPKQGFVNDIASKINASADGKTYIVTIRDDARFHNGDLVGPKDVLFTFDALRNPLYRSPLASLYQSVDISQVDDHTLTFSLKNPSAFFPSLLTVGLLPSDIWSEIAPRNTPLAEYNLKPIGSGPYKFQEFTKDKKGNIRSYTLVRNDDFYGYRPPIERLTFKFYDDADTAIKALGNRNAEGIAYVPPLLELEAEKTHATHFVRPEIPRETALFFNQNKQALFKNKTLRQAIALALDRQTVVNEALFGYGQTISGPVLAEDLPSEAASSPIAPNLVAANKLLDDAGFARPEGSEIRHTKKPEMVRIFKKGKKIPAPPAPSTMPELSFTLTTVQTPEFTKAAQLIATQLSAIGIKVQIEAVEPPNLFKSILEPRNYELLLTGILFGSDGDPYPFWHSSQAVSTGLNLAGYASKKADDLLEKARQTMDQKARADVYAQFQQLIADDVPAVFLYRPTYAYGVGNKVKGVSLSRINVPSDRFANIADWYVKTKKVLR